MISFVRLSFLLNDRAGPSDGQESQEPDDYQEVLRFYNSFVHDSIRMSLMRKLGVCNVIVVGVCHPSTVV